MNLQNIDEVLQHYAKGKKSSTKTVCWMIPFIEILEKEKLRNQNADQQEPGPRVREEINFKGHQTFWG